MTHLLLLLSVQVLLGCAPALTPIPFDTAELDEEDGAVEETTDDEGLTISTVALDASDYTLWVRFDLHDGIEVSDDGSGAEELLLQRYHVQLAEGVLAAVLVGADFGALTEAPSGEYVDDAPDADKDGIPEYVLGGWYDYDPKTHILTPADVVYVLSTAGGDYFRLQFLDYYDSAGSSGHPAFRWGPLPPPSSSEQ